MQPVFYWWSYNYKVQKALLNKMSPASVSVQHIILNNSCLNCTYHLANSQLPGTGEEKPICLNNQTNDACG